MKYFQKVKVFNTGRTRFKKGNVPKNKGIKKPKPKCLKCGIELSRYGNSKSCNKHRSFTWGNKISKSLIGIPNFKVRGENHGLWKGGITPINQKIRGSIENKIWIYSVFSKDGFICQKTGIKGGKLVAHHIQNFADFPELFMNNLCYNVSI